MNTETYTPLLLNPAREFAEAISEAGNYCHIEGEYNFYTCPFCERSHDGTGWKVKENHDPECVVLKARIFLATNLKASQIKRFALLAGDTYYPSPGWNGFDSWHDTIESAVEKGQQIASESLTWFQVLDTQDFKIVAGSGEAHTGLFGKVSCAVPPIHHVFSDNGEDTKDSRWETATLKEILSVVGQTAAERPDAVFTIVEI